MSFLLMASCFTACSDDDDKKNEEPQNPEETVDSIIGTWIEDDSDAPYIMNLRANRTGSIEYTVSDNDEYSRASLMLRQNFSWSEGVDSDGLSYVTILTTSGDNILNDGHYYYTVIGDIMKFGGIRFTKQ